MKSDFWVRVRQLRREIAIELYMQDHKELEVFNTPEELELKEGGYWGKAKVLALRKLRLEEFTLRTLKESRREEHAV